MTIKKLILLNVCLLILNILLSTFLFILDDSGAYHLDGSYTEAHSLELFWILIKTQIISIPIICLILGLITSLFVEKQLPYQKRYWKGFLLTLSVVYGLFSISGLIKVIVYFF